MSTEEHFDTIVIGGGQSGLSMGYELSRMGKHFVILEAGASVSESWRQRWDSLRLFTPGWYVSLNGMRFTGRRASAPTRDEFADYLEAYRSRFDLPVRTGVRVTRVFRQAGTLVVEAGGVRLEADEVVVATGFYQHPWTPVFAKDLNPEINQIHSREYKNLLQVKPGSVLVVGAGNSGADICMETSPEHQTYLAGRHPGHIPFRIDGLVTRNLVHLVRFVGHHVLTRRTPLGRKVMAKMHGRAKPVVRVKPKDILAAGVERVPRVVGVIDGMPQLEDGRILDVANVVWCTGFRQDFAWIDLPIFGESGLPRHDRGVVAEVPGLYFLGLEFQYAFTSDIITGVGRDSAYLAAHMAARSSTRSSKGGKKEKIPAKV